MPAFQIATMPATEDILDIAPPLPLPGSPWPALLLILLLLLAAAAFLFWRLKNRPTPPPPSPRQIALDKLRDLAALQHEIESEPFAERVSAVLRQFITAQFGLRAEYQTTQEFLQTANRSLIFPQVETDLLGRFLNEADQLKFGGARAAAPARVNGRLLDLASAFVRGDAA